MTVHLLATAESIARACSSTWSASTNLRPCWPLTARSTSSSSSIWAISINSNGCAGSARTRWRIGIADWEQWHHHSEFTTAGAQIIYSTSDDYTPWHVVNGWDDRNRNFTVAALLHDALRQRQRARRRRNAASSAVAVVPELPLAFPLRQLVVPASDQTVRQDRSAARRLP